MKYFVFFFLFSSLWGQEKYFGGVGMGFRSLNSIHIVSHLIPNTPLTGVSLGDTIQAVNGKIVNGLESQDLLTLLRGPVGSPVHLQFRGKHKVYDTHSLRISIKVIEWTVDEFSDFLGVENKEIDSALIAHSLVASGFSREEIKAVLLEGVALRKGTKESKQKITVVLSSDNRNLQKLRWEFGTIKKTENTLVVQLKQSGIYELGLVNALGKRKKVFEDRYFERGEYIIPLDQNISQKKWIVFKRNGSTVLHTPFWSL